MFLEINKIHKKENGEKLSPFSHRLITGNITF